MFTRKFWRDRLIFFVAIWLFTISVASFIIIASTGGVNSSYWETIQNIAIRAVFNFASYIIIFSLLITLLDRFFPFGGKRVIIRLGISAIVGIGVGYLFAKLNALFPFPPRMQVVRDQELFLFVITFFQCGMIFTTLEIYEMLKRNRRLNNSLARLETERIQTQLQVLRQQINPHFLFNCLNVLSELMHSDLDKAEAFIDHFARIYRYALKFNQEKLVPLKKELQFLDSYLYLQRIRFGDNLLIENQLSPEVLQSLVPPLSLQILFENAIKHNVISSEKPLRINMQEKDGMLQIGNNYQAHGVPASGTGIGLNNLKNKYLLLQHASPRFYFQQGEYIAQLPLIWITP